MLSRKNENSGADKQFGLLLLSASGMLLLLMLIIILASFLTAGDQFRLNLTSRALSATLPASILSTLGDQAQLMDLPLQSGSQAYWYLARAGGVVAYILLWLATCWGIMMSSKFIKGLVSVPLAYALHEFLPILGVVFAALHAVALLGDSYIGFNVWHLLVPFSSPYEPIWTGLGSLALYLFLALIASTYLRKQIGQKLWRALHFTAYLAFLASLLHGVMAGSDSGSLGMRALYLVTGGISLFLLYYRMLSHAPKKSGARTNRLPERGGKAHVEP